MLLIVQHLDIVEDALLGLVTVSVDPAMNTLPFGSWKKLSTTVLARQLPRRLIFYSGRGLSDNRPSRSY